MVRAIFEGVRHPPTLFFRAMNMAKDAGKDETPSLDAFSERLDAANSMRPTEVPAKHAKGAAWGRALRISSDLLAGLIVGFVIGLLLDRYLGTTPWLLFLGMTIGFAAGLRNMSRTLKEMNASASDG